MKPITTIAISFGLLWAATMYMLWLGWPYAKRGYDDSVIERAGIAQTAQISEALMDAPVKPRGMK